MADRAARDDSWGGARTVLRRMHEDAAANPTLPYAVRVEGDEEGLPMDCTLDDVVSILTMFMLFDGDDEFRRFFNYGGSEFLIRLAAETGNEKLISARKEYIKSLALYSRQRTQQTMSRDAIALVHNEKAASLFLGDLLSLDDDKMLWQEDFSALELIARTHPSLAHQCVTTLVTMKHPTKIDSFNYRTASLKYFLLTSLTPASPWAIHNTTVLETTLSALEGIVGSGDCPSAPLAELAPSILDVIDRYAPALNTSSTATPVSALAAPAADARTANALIEAALRTLTAWLAVPFSAPPHEHTLVLYGGWRASKPCYAGMKDDIARAVSLRLGASDGVRRLATWLQSVPESADLYTEIVAMHTEMLEVMLYTYLVEIYFPEEACPRLSSEAMVSLETLIIDAKPRLLWVSAIVSLLKAFYAGQPQPPLTTRAWTIDFSPTGVYGYYPSATRPLIVLQSLLSGITMSETMFEACNASLVDRTVALEDAAMLERLLRLSRVKPDLHAMTRAVELNRADLLEVLIAHGGKCNDAAEVASCNKVSPLEHAIDLGQVPLVALMLDRGGVSVEDVIHTKPNKYDASMKNTQTLLVKAIAAGQPQVVREFVLRGADVNRWDGPNFPLAFSLSRATFERALGPSHQEITANLLLDHGANACVESPTPGNRILSIYHPNMLERLIAHGAHVDYTPQEADSSLLCALQKNQREAATILIAYGASLPNEEELERLSRVIGWRIQEHDGDFDNELDDWRPHARLLADVGVAPEQAMIYLAANPRPTFNLQPSKVQVFHRDGEKTIYLPWSERLHPLTPRAFQREVRVLLHLRHCALSPDAAASTQSPSSPSAAGSSELLWASLPNELFENVLDWLYQLTLRHLRATAPHIPSNISWNRN